MKYYIDSFGKYLGGTDGDPLSTNEVPNAPDDARKTWDGKAWIKSQLLVSEEAKKARDKALESLTYDFLDGRVMQTRPRDESNIRNAIEIMTAQNLTTIDWVMIDNVKYPVTVIDLQTALTAGQIAALAIWNSYVP